MLGIFVDMVGIYIFLRNKDSLKVLWVIPLFSGFFYQQSMVAGVATCIVYLVINNWRRRLLFAGIFAVIAGGIFITANILTRGNYLREVYLYQRTSPVYQSPGYSGYSPYSLCTLSSGYGYGSSWLSKQKGHLFQIFMCLALIVNVRNIVHPGGNLIIFSNLRLRFVFVPGCI